ncbi:MAG TPA: hypothetical protein ENN55_06005, partial [Firmicutes bacterium]|nr:hypothetical protein [Bacillota bacterium]
MIIPEVFRRNFLIWILLALIIIFIILGSGHIFIEAGKADNEKRAELLQKAELFVRGIKTDETAMLKGKPEDAGTDIYKRIKSQFVNVMAAYPRVKFIYIMGENQDGEIVFFVDSAAEGSADASPPGQIYSEASTALKNVLISGSGIVEGPYSDRWGTFVSALVPF